MAVFGAGPLRNGLKVTLAGVFEHSGALTVIARARRSLAGPRVHILGFHRVVDDMAAIGEEIINALCISTASFERLLDLARERFDVLSLDDACAVLDGRRRAERDVLVITF